MSVLLPVIPDVCPSLCRQIVHFTYYPIGYIHRTSCQLPLQLIWIATRISELSYILWYGYPVDVCFSPVWVTFRPFHCRIHQIKCLWPHLCKLVLHDQLLMGSQVTMSWYHSLTEISFIHAAKKIPLPDENRVNWLTFLHVEGAKALKSHRYG